MIQEITQLAIENDMDLVLAHRRAMQLSRFSGMGLAEQTRFATAVSEICRNCLEFVGKGDLQFGVRQEGDSHLLVATISDKGKGISNIKSILSRDPRHHKGRGLGIVFAKRLIDHFKIETNGGGTKVWLEKVISARIPLNRIIIKGWAQHLTAEPAVSPYEELKEKNSQLIQLTEELRGEKETIESQITEIQQLNTKLERSNETMRQFTYAVSHDLKTPLTSLRMALSYVEEQQAGKEVDSYFQIIQRSVKRLDKAIHSLVELLDLQSSATGLVKKLNLKDTFEDVLEDFSERVNALHGTVESYFPEEDVVYVETYLKSIFSNLISNSVKYASPDNPLVIRITTKRVANAFQIDFSDNGKGIDMEKNGADLFKPFTRFSSDTEGKGIGLYMIKNMVERNGGTIDVNSEINKGVSFRFYLPEYG